MPFPPWFAQEKKLISKLPPSERGKAIRALLVRVQNEFSAAGKCRSCGRPAVRSGSCLTHSAKIDMANERRRERLNEAGICIECGNEPIDPSSKSRCRPCLDKHAANMKEERDELLRLKLCDTCKEPLSDGHSAVSCDSCLEVARKEKRAARARWAEEGKCTRCGKARDGETRLCESCLMKNRKRRGDGTDVIKAIVTVIDYELKNFETGVIVIDEKYLEAKEIVFSRAV